MVKKFTFLFFLFIFSIGFAQNEVEIDSLKKVMNHYDATKSKVALSLSDSVKVKLLLQLSKCYKDCEPNTSMTYANKALTLSNTIKYYKGASLSYYLIGNTYNNKSDFFLAIKCFNKSMLINKMLNDKLLLADSYLALGQSYLYLNNFPEALNKIQSALFIYEKLNKKLKVCRALNNLAILYNKQGKHEEELNIYFKALTILKTQKRDKDAEWLTNTINGNIGNAYLDQKKFKEALAIFLQCLPIDAKYNRINNEAQDYESIGLNYMYLGENEKAIFHLIKALELFQQMHNRSGEADTFRHIGEFYLNTGDNVKALQNAQKGLAISQQIGELESIKFGYEVLSKIYSATKNYKAAYESQVGYKKYSDSILNSEINRKLIQLQMTNEFDRREDVLKKEQSKKDEQLKVEAEKQKKIKYIVLTTLFLLSLITISIYRNLKNYQKQRNIIQKQKEQIENSLQEKETLLREMHHRVKNNLQIISSLLNMQSEEIHDPAVLASIQEGQSRVEAMSLIHQNLYQSEEINKVDVEKYLKELINYLSKMFEGNSKNIQVQITTFDIKFDFDTAIPLGLIVNELVSNAFKYGFDAKECGSICITIRAINALDYELKVVDDGKGIPDDFDIKNLKSLGLKLVSILSRQLRGHFSVEKKDGLTSFVVLFKDLKAYNATT